ncbi:dihydrodipicolinate synthase family protein [Psychromicrobium sp. YIM B11713]|uniref:dihydrodipicolinate synthase family protein n=1 Tax=Psychromicrobium sp. YIM B11713 TaxID=3145233 RepID=UPI00374F909A
MIFNGLLAYPITPSLEDGRPDLESLGRHSETLAQSGVSAISVLGSSGDFAYLNRQERAQVIKVAVESAAGRVPIVAGISAIGLREVLEHISDAQSAGAAGLLLSPQSYNPLSDSEVIGLGEAAAAATELPLCLYQNARTTQYAFSLEVVAELAAVSNIVAFKDNALSVQEFRGRQLGLAGKVPEDFSHGLSGDAMIAQGTPATAWHSGPAALVPELYLALRGAVQRGEPGAIEAASRPLAEFIAVLGSLPKASTLHSLARLRGVRTAGPRRPILPLDSGQEKLLAAALETALSR